MRVEFEKVDSVEDEVATIKAMSKSPDIESAISILEGLSECIPGLVDGKTVLIRIRGIYYIESVDKKSFVYTKEGCFETKLRLYELEDKLGLYFARCSKAMIVNLKKVKCVNSELGGRMIATLLNDEELIVSRSYVKDIKRRLEI